MDGHAPASASARAAASPTRTPVKLPGPQSTRRDRSLAPPGIGEQLGDLRHQPLGMAAADDLVPLGHDRAAVEQRDRAGRRRRIDDQIHAARLRRSG